MICAGNSAKKPPRISFPERPYCIVEKEIRLSFAVSLLVQFFLPEQLGAEVIIVHVGDVGHFDLLRAFGFAGAGVGAVAKAFVVHLRHHGLYTAVTLWLALRQHTQLGYLSRNE